MEMNFYNDNELFTSPLCNNEICAKTGLIKLQRLQRLYQNSTYSYAICFNSIYYLFCSTLFFQTAWQNIGNLALEAQISIESYSASSSTLDGGICSNVVTIDRLNPAKKTKTVFFPPSTICIS